MCGCGVWLRARLRDVEDYAGDDGRDSQRSDKEKAARAMNAIDGDGEAGYRGVGAGSGWEVNSAS
jgi:hypothetical protein